MTCTEVYKEHIMYTLNGFCKVVIRYAAINAWRERSRRRQKEISFEYLTVPYEEYPITICGQTIILTNGELAAMQTEQEQAKAASEGVEKFMTVVRQHMNFKKLTHALLREFVEKIVVHEAENTGSGRKQQIGIY